MFNRSLGLFLSFVALLFIGCNSSDDDFVASPPSQVPQVATIRLTQVLLRAVPQEVTQQRFSGFDSQGILLYGPFTRNKAATIELENVPTTITRLQIEYLQGETVIGLGSVAVNLVFGETFEVTNPPFQDVVSALSSLQVTPGGITIADGSAQQFTVIGTFADNTQVDLTSSATWSSSNTAVATIAPGGLATAVDPGDTTITANIGPVSNSTTLTVSNASITSIDVTPNSPSIANGTTQQFTATANLSDGSTQDVTTSVVWASNATGVATIGANTGLAQAQSDGQTTISATLGSVTASTTLNVNSAAVTSLVISPGNQTIAAGTTQQFTVTANFSSGPSQDVTSSATWTSSVPGTASITNPGGLASALAAGGSTVIQASFGGETASTNLTVSAAEIASVEVTPMNPVIVDGTEQQFTATATLTDNSNQDVTNSASWISSTTATATIQSSGDTNPGLASAVDPGQSNITAAVGSISGSATLTVSQASVQSITVTPANPTVANGVTQQFTAVATLSDTSTQDVTSSATWDSGTVGVATITNPGGLASVVADTGTSQISASFSGETGSTTLTASAATLETITINPNPAILAEGETQDFTATGNFSDGSNSDITNSVTWDSNDTNVATIVATGVNAGRASSAGVGSTEVRATSGSVTGSAVIVVTDATLQSIDVQPPAALTAPGSSRRYRAIGTFSDGSNQDLTTQVTWSSSDTGVTIDNDDLGPNTIGEASVDLAEPFTGTGTPATITATLGSISGSSTLHIGAFAYVANSDSDNLSVLTIDSASGALTAGTPVATGLFPGSIAVDPTGRFVYVTNGDENTISVFTIDPTDGALSAGTTATVAAGSFPLTVAVDPTGRFAYVGSNVGNDVTVFTIDQTTGALTAIQVIGVGSTPASVTVDPTGRFAYSASGFGNNLSAFSINQTTGALASVQALMPGTNSRSVTVDPSGRFLYLGNGNVPGILVFTINQTTGALTAGPTASTTFTPDSLAVDPSGRFVYAVFSSPATNNLIPFTINPTTGALTAGTAVTAGGEPFSVTVDPTGRFVYTANRGSDNVSIFLIDQFTGALTAPAVGAAVAVGTDPRFVVTTP